MLNLDTHVLLHALAGRLSPAELRLLENDQWSISAIVLWEIAKLAQAAKELDNESLTAANTQIEAWVKKNCDTTNP